MCERRGIRLIPSDGGRFAIWCVRDAGFCFGVERAIRIATDAAARHGEIHSLGPLIHNNQAVERLESQGIHVASSLQETGGGPVITRSHGLAPGLLEEAKRRGIDVIDGTCPFVEKAQQYVKLLREEGYEIVIVGNAEHPEVKGLLGFSGKDVQVVSNSSELKPLKTPRRVGVVAQTTERVSVFVDVVGTLIESAKEVRVYNTICDSVLSRRENTSKLASTCDVVIVVGGRHSANTTQLAATSMQLGTETHRIERPEELEASWFVGKSAVGVTVGASTPGWITAGVINRLKELSHERG